MKVCCRCKVEKPAGDFTPNKQMKWGLHPSCRLCNAARNRERYPQRKDAIAASNKRWAVANPERVRANQRRWAKENPKRIKSAQLRHFYGISLEDMVALLLAQGGCCAICKNPLDVNASRQLERPCVDHSHDTGAVRGLLCTTCNSGLGLFQDSVEVLVAAQNYLLQSRPTSAT